jgi:hypothetical protein
MKSKSLTISLAASLGLASCQAMLEKQHPPAVAQPAANPLGGTALAYDREPAASELQSLRSDECSIWPIQDHIELVADERQICVQASLHAISELDVGDMFSFVIQGDGASSPKLAMDPPSTTRKIGSCARRSGDVEPTPIDVWVTSYRGCTGNNGLLNAATKRLVVKNQPRSRPYDLAAWELGR